MSVMPECFYKGDEFSGYEEPRLSDREYISEQLERLPFQIRVKVSARYSEEYMKIINDESIPPHIRENKARRECNTRLRAAVESLLTTSKPPSE